ncbi:LPXTG cell wall anchor domain-containing protein, partial [Staphylococcus saprophyticus]
DNSYPIIFGEEPNQSPTTLFVKKDTGDIYDYDGNLVQKGSVGSEDTNQNNEQQTPATDNTVTQDNTQSQSEAQTLPETGETSNTTLV